MMRIDNDYNFRSLLHLHFQVPLLLVRIVQLVHIHQTSLNESHGLVQGLMYLIIPMLLLIDHLHRLLQHPDLYGQHIP